MGSIQVNVIFEDNHLLVVEKPVNVLSQQDITGDPDMLSILKNDIKKRFNKPGDVYLGLVHRLDRPVGGVMVFARTSKSASRLSEQIRNRSFEKRYVAVVRGTPTPSAGTLRHYLIKDGAANTVYNAESGSEKAMEAVLDYETEQCLQGMSLVNIRLHTGRAHQIRAQMSLSGYPLYGDQKYGSRVNKPGQQLALWSVGIAFMHPTKNEKMEFKSLPPNQFPWDAFDMGGVKFF